MGEPYLVYAERSADGALATNICWRTARLAGAAGDLERLGPPSVPIPGDTNLPMMLPVLVSAAAGLLLVRLVRLVVRRRFRADARR